MTAIVLLPGMDGTGTLFADLVSAFDEHVDVLTITYPGDRIMGYAELANLVASRLPHNKSFVLVGESFSGPIAIELAASGLPGLAGVILCCSFAKNPAPLFYPLRRLIGFFASSRKLAEFASPLAFGRFSNRRLRSLLSNSLTMVSKEVLKARVRAVFEVDYSDKLRNIAAPVLYMQAAQDRLVPASALRRIRLALPGIGVVKMNGPHFLLQTMPKESATVIQGFADAVIAAHRTSVEERAQSQSAR